jgi:hypothetical protein
MTTQKLPTFISLLGLLMAMPALSLAARAGKVGITSSQAPIGTAFVYQGRLVNDSGQPGQWSL